MIRETWLLCLSVYALVHEAAAGNSTDGSCGPLNGFNVCTERAHCCRYGWCGNGGTYCAQGCNPLFSYNIEACYPLPVCQSKKYTFGDNGNARLTMKDRYNKVDPNHIDFIIDTGEVQSSAEGAVLTLKKDKIGAKITSTRAMRYGRMTVELQTAWSGGVVTAAVLMGDTTEEVDVEFTGNALRTMQSNVFYNGIADSTSHVLGGDSSGSFANYSVTWEKDKLEWGFGKGDHARILRTTTSEQKHIPRLPMYVQVSIWPGGDSKAPGTSRWSGGRINWNNARFKKSGDQFQVVVKSITVECFDEYRPDQAYKYVHSSKSGERELDFKVVKLKGYGVSKRPVPTLRLQASSEAAAPVHQSPKAASKTEAAGDAEQKQSDSRSAVLSVEAGEEQSSGGASTRLKSIVHTQVTKTMTGDDAGLTRV